MIKDMNGYWVENSLGIYEALLELGLKPFQHNAKSYPQIYIQNGMLFGADMLRDYVEIFKRKEAKLQNGEFVEAPFRVTLAHQLMGQ